jgi:hypothetical protein
LFANKKTGKRKGVRRKEGDSGGDNKKNWEVCL